MSVERQSAETVSAKSRAAGTLMPVLGTAFLCALSVLTGCATAKPGDTTAASGKPQVARPVENGSAACFYARDVQDFRAISRGDLIVFAPNRKHAYQVRIAPPTSELRFSDAVAFLSRSTRICGYAGEDLVIPGAGGPQRYAVLEVASLTPETVDRLLGRETDPGTGAEVSAPGTKPTPKPGTAGAELERDLEKPAPAR